MNNLCAKKKVILSETPAAVPREEWNIIEQGILALDRAKEIPWASVLMTQPRAGLPERHNSQQKPETAAPHFIWGKSEPQGSPGSHPHFPKESLDSATHFPELITLFKRSHQ